MAKLSAVLMVSFLQAELLTGVRVLVKEPIKCRLQSKSSGTTERSPLINPLGYGRGRIHPAVELLALQLFDR